MLLFKTARVEDEWASPSLDPTLRELIEFLVLQAGSLFGLDVTLTCIYRSPAEDAELYHDNNHVPGVHTQWRGADVSVKDYTWAQAKQLCNVGNRRWQYDPGRPWLPCFLFETSGDYSTAAHIHCQTDPPLTKPIDILADSEIGNAL